MGQETNALKEKPVFPCDGEGKPSVALFFVALALIVGLTFTKWAIDLVGIYAVRITLILLVIAAYTAVAIIAMKLTSQAKKLLPSKHQLGLQILLGFGIAAALCFSFGVLPILFGTSLIGSHMELSAGGLAVNAIEDIFFVGPGEEIVFRGYI